MKPYKDARIHPVRRHRRALLLLVPLVLIVALVALLPRATSSGFRLSGASASGAPGERYVVVIDAGSTGSRVHVFKFDILEGGVLDLAFDKFEQLKPGLSAHADDPKAAAASLAPLLDLAVETIPEEHRKSTRVTVGATAGLRLLPGTKADDILSAVRAFVQTYPFSKVRREDVSILSGTSEGAYAWLTLNYLLGHLGQPELRTVAAIDLGGGSVQEAFAMTEAEARASPDSSYVSVLHGGGRSYKVYVNSYLGFGLMAARAAVLAATPEAAELGHACIHSSHNSTYSYAGVDYAVKGHAESSLEPCMAAVLAALRHGESCGAPQLQCTFAGTWGGERTPAAFYVSSYFWDRATDAGIITDAEAIEQTITPGRFSELGGDACGADDATLQDRFPRVSEDIRPFFCLDLVYIHQLLVTGFKVPEHSTVTIVKKVRHKSGDIEAAWPLGAAINSLG